MYKKILIISMFIVSLFGITVFAVEIPTLLVPHTTSVAYKEKDNVFVLNANSSFYAEEYYDTSLKKTYYKIYSDTDYFNRYGINVSGNILKPTWSAASKGDSIVSKKAIVSISEDDIKAGNITMLYGHIIDFPLTIPEPEPEVPTENYIDIKNLAEGIKVTGYQSGSTSLKWYDIDVYGNFIWDKDNLLPSSTLQTTIQNSFMVWHGSDVRRMGEGLGVKSFHWINRPQKRGDLGEFRIVLQMPILKMGVHDITVGCTLDTREVSTYVYTWITDKVKGVEFLIDNTDENFPLPPPEVPEGGTSGEVGGNGGSNNGSDVPQPPEDGSIFDWIKYIIDLFFYLISYPFKLLGDIITTTSGYIGDAVANLSPVGHNLKGVLSFIPDDIMNTLWGILCFSIVFSTIKMITGFMRGR